MMTLYDNTEESPMDKALSFLKACAKSMDPLRIAEFMGYPAEAAPMLFAGSIPIESKELWGLRQARELCGNDWDEAFFTSAYDALRAAENTTHHAGWISPESTYHVPNDCAMVLTPMHKIKRPPQQDNELTLRHAAAELLNAYRTGTKRRLSIISNAAEAQGISLSSDLLESIEARDLETPFPEVAACVRYLCIAEITGGNFKARPERAERFCEARRATGQRFRCFGFEDITID